LHSRVFAAGDGVAAIFAAGRRDRAKVPSTLGNSVLAWRQYRRAPIRLPPAA
jgi:hypothetical protein